jgi:hypothetical protein
VVVRTLAKTHSLVFVAVVLSLVTSACSGKADSFCSRSSSVAGVALMLSNGLSDISESQYATLRSDLLFAHNAAFESMKDQPEDSDSTRFYVKLQKFTSIMEELSWDFSEALLDVAASNAAANLGTPAALREANTVESFVITTCGMPSTVPFEATVDTLPSPSIPGPTATDPPSSNQNQKSENIATGKVLAAIYGVSISDTEAQCLGSLLGDVVDATSASADSAQYAQQFQKAFDVCGINTAIVPNP